MDFWEYFETISRKLGARKEGFERIFKELDKIECPIIIETGCVRRDDSYDSDGSSSILFDNYVHFNPCAEFITIDISKESTDCAKRLCKNAEIITADSVAELARIATTGLKVDLLYLDSFDCIWADTLPSATHHLKELNAALPMITPQTLVVVDDCFFDGTVRGKGSLVANELVKYNAHAFYEGYQCGWTGINLP